MGGGGGAGSCESTTCTRSRSVVNKWRIHLSPRAQAYLVCHFLAAEINKHPHSSVTALGCHRPEAACTRGYTLRRYCT